MKKLVVVTSFAALSLVASVTAVAGDACATIMCLAGPVAGQGLGGGSCSKPIDSYFDIKKYKHGKYSESRTFQARQQYLDSCQDKSTEPLKAMIQSRYGVVPNNPGGLF